MRKASRVDANQAAIVAALRKVGASVLHLHQLGHGAVDIIVGFAGENLMMEIKDGTKPPSARKLTPDEQKFHSDWRGQICVVDSVGGALSALALAASSKCRCVDLRSNIQN